MHWLLGELQAFWLQGHKRIYSCLLSHSKWTSLGIQISTNESSGRLAKRLVDSSHFLSPKCTTNSNTPETTFSERLWDLYNVFQLDSLSYLLESFQPIAIPSEFWFLAMSFRSELWGWRWAWLSCDWSRSIGTHYWLDMRLPYIRCDVTLHNCRSQCISNPANDICNEFR